MKIIYIGSSSPLSLTPLKSLIKSAHEVCAIAVEDVRNSEFNVITSNTIQSLALSNLIPLFSLNNNQSEFISQLRKIQPDIILVSCYSRRVPQSILSLARKGSFNVHPSLLPQFRGPNPLFWQLREGVCEFGITMHRMTDNFDAGNIISQQKIKLNDGLYNTEITNLLANVAGDLVLNTFDNINNDNLVEIKQLEELSSYQSMPSINDYTVSTSWTAKRLYNFINAYKYFDVYFLCDINGKEYKLIDALSYQESTCKKEVPYKKMHDDSEKLDGDRVTFSCEDGFIECKYKI